MSWRNYYKNGFTSPFGDCRPVGSNPCGRRHRGQDLSHSRVSGTIAVPSLFAGTVVRKYRPNDGTGFGHGIVIRSLLGDGNLWDFYYAHGPWASSQQVGEKVAQGQIILHEGLSGFTSGPCVHIEQQRVGGGFTDPRPEINRVAAGQDNYGSTPAPAPAPKPQPAPSGKPAGYPGGMHDWWWLGIQAMLKRDFGYKGPLDGRAGWKNDTAKAFQRFLNAKGYARKALGTDLVIDGDLQTKSVKAAQQWLSDTGRNPKGIDGVPGGNTHSAFKTAENQNYNAYKKFYGI